GASAPKSSLGGDQLLFRNEFTVGDALACAAAAPPHQQAGDGKHHRKHSGQEHDELPDRPTPAAIVDPPYPLRSAVAGKRIGQTARTPALIVDRDGDEIVVRVAQLHAPSRRSCGRSPLALSALAFTTFALAALAFAPLAFGTALCRRQEQR